MCQWQVEMLQLLYDELFQDGLSWGEGQWCFNASCLREKLWGCGGSSGEKSSHGLWKLL